MKNYYLRVYLDIGELDCQRIIRADSLWDALRLAVVEHREIISGPRIEKVEVKEFTA